MLELKIDTYQPNGVFQIEQDIKIFVLIHNYSEKRFSGRLTWRVKTDSGDRLVENIVSVELLPGKNRHDYNFEPDQLCVGFYQIESQFQFCQQVVSDQMTIGYQPSSLQVSLTRQPDFDDFWHGTESQLRQIEPNYQSEFQPNMENNRFKVYLVEICSFDNLRVRGWLEVPKTI